MLECVFLALCLHLKHLNSDLPLFFPLPLCSPFFSFHLPPSSSFQKCVMGDVVAVRTYVKEAWWDSWPFFLDDWITTGSVQWAANEQQSCTYLLIFFIVLPTHIYALYYSNMIHLVINIVLIWIKTLKLPSCSHLKWLHDVLVGFSTCWYSRDNIDRWRLMCIFSSLTRNV